MTDSVESLRAALARCTIRDRAVLSRRLLRAEREGGGRLGRLRREIGEAVAARAARLEGAPRPSFPEELPITRHREEIARAIAEHPVVVVCGETGSGKSTQLPKICLEAGRGVDGVIGMTQPRRIAARTVAQRLAEELGVPLGRGVGYKVRFTDETGPDTYVKVLTDGMLLAEMQGDRRLLRYDTVIIDEAHERSLNIDFLMGCVGRLLEGRDDLRLVIASATIDPERFSRHFGDAPVVEVSGRTYPVEVRYRPPGAGPDEEPVGALLGAVEELKAEGPGDILVFLPGEREIREAAEAIRGSDAGRGAEVMPLFARLPAKDQMRAFQPHEQRRIILATNIAETSVTVPGVRYVVDTGLARISRYGARARLQGLPIEPVSRASASQRAGRCGRVAEGVCVRLYSEEDFASRPEFTDPEIARSNLAGVVLQMRALRLGDPETFPFIDRPSARRLRDGHETLVELGAIDGEAELTAVGKTLARLPVDPRLGRMLIAGAEEGSLREVLVLAAALATRDPRERPADRREEADGAQKQFVDPRSDFMTLLKLWNAARAAERERSGRGFRRWCQHAYVSWRALREWQDLQRQLRRQMTELGYRRGAQAAEADAVHRAVLSGLLGNVGMRGDRHEYRGTHGTEFFIHPGSAMFGRKPKWIVAAEITRTTQVYARMVAPVNPAWIAELGSHLLDRSYSTPSWDDSASTATVIERASIYGLRLPRKRRVPYGRQNPVVARELFIQHGLVEGRFRPDAEFVERNDETIRRVRRLEAKARRRDLHAEAGARFDFFDRLLPREVWSGKRFERWRHRAERREPRLLWMRERDLLTRDEGTIAPESFPDRVRIAGRARELEYRHEPGQPDDGVVLQLPVAALAELTEGGYDWLVPGLVRERVIELVRALPKPLRRGVGPAPEAADAFLESEPDRTRPLADSLAAFLGSTRGVALDGAALRAVQLPAHVAPKLVVVDESGRVLAEGRDVVGLKRQVSGEVRDTLRRAVPDLGRGAMRSWELDELPLSERVRSGGATVTAHLALVDEEDSVAVRHFPDREEALGLHWQGVRRLLVLGCRRELVRSLRGRPGLGAMRLAYASLGRHESLDDQLMLLAAEQGAGRERMGAVRDAGEFERLLVAFESGLDAAVAGSFDLAERVLSGAAGLVGRLDRPCPAGWRPVADDLREQLAGLLPEPPLSATGLERLSQVPRYLDAGVRRWDKLATGSLERDQRAMMELAPRWARWTALCSELAPIPRAAAVWEAAERYRWMLEEFRVSLFAQELRTALKVSGVRLDRLWAELREAVRADARLAHLFSPSVGV